MHLVCTEGSVKLVANLEKNASAFPCTWHWMATSSLLGSPNWALHPGISLLCVSDISQRFPERPSSLQIGFTLLKISWEVEPHAFFSYSMTAGHHFGKHAGDPHCKRSQATEALHFSYRKGKVWVLLFQPITPIGPLYNHFSTSLSIGSIFPKAIRKISLHFPFLFPFCSSLSTGGEMKQRAGGERAICLYFLCIFPYPFSFLCWPSVQIPAPPPLKKKQPKNSLFSHFSSQSRAWASRRAMCPVCSLWIVSSHKRSSGNHYTS